MDEKDDTYMKVKGYLKEEEQHMEGINPSIVFVPVELLAVDKSRGCERAIQQGK